MRACSAIVVECQQAGFSSARLGALVTCKLKEVQDKVLKQDAACMYVQRVLN